LTPSTFLHPCGFAYISRHSHHTLFQVLTLADIVHFALLSPPCTFPGFQIIRHSEHRFLALSSTARYLLYGLRQPLHDPARIFSGILLDPFYLLPAHVTLGAYSQCIGHFGTHCYFFI